MFNINSLIIWASRFYTRVEFEASIDLNSVEDEGALEMPSIIDEEEWTQQNFGDSLRLAQGNELILLAMFNGLKPFFI
jgi:hypothetical protein